MPSLFPTHPRQFHPRHARRKNAFTLIELLIVIAIVGLLAAILFPVFGRVRENARRSSCASNLKQIGLAMVQYTQDYDERFPMRQYPTTTSWRSMIYPYVKSLEVYRCPSNVNNKNVAGQDATSPIPIKVSYSANENVMGLTPVMPLSNVQKPAELIMVGEETAGDSIIKMDCSPAIVAAHTRGPWAGHGGGTANYLFVDGHVKAMRPTLTVPGAVFTSTTDNFWVNTYPGTSFDTLFDVSNTPQTTTKMQTNARAYMQGLENAYD